MTQRLARPVEEQYKVPQVAALLNVDRSVIYRLIQSKAIKPVVLVGSTMRVPASSVNRYLESRKV